MHLSILSVVICVVLAGMGGLMGSRCAAGEPVILVTAFGPFDGRGINGSETVARRLEGTIIAGARVAILIVPVRWGEPERQLPAAVERLKPVALLGLGEGLPGHTVYVEQVGANQAKAFPDVGGVLPQQPILEATAPVTRPARLRFDPTWFSDSSLHVVASQDAGGYLCNEMLFTALGQPVNVCGFVHLPPQGAVADALYSDGLVPIVKSLLAHNLAP